ncbi:MAG: sensor histidine kinase [Breznakibacter sp.]
MILTKDKRIKNIGIHTSIWVGYSLLIFYGPITFLPLKAALLFGIRALVINAFIFYFNTFWLLPKFFFTGKYIKYLLMVAAIVSTATAINSLSEPYIFPEREAKREAIREIIADMDAHPDGERETRRHLGPPPTFMFLPAKLPPMVINAIFSSLGMFFLSTFFVYIIRDRELQQKKLDLTNQNLEFEMKFLKSQINPHFLFNALNNVYALSVIKAENTPEMILKLSEMLRFTLYDSESQKVKVERELSYISNYIDFQRLKMDTEPNLTVSIDQCNRELMIEPMLLIPFVENSFKHSHIENTKKGWIKLKIHSLGSMLFFSISNSIMPSMANRDLPGGIGLENVRKRLELLYPGRFELKIESTTNEHRVQLMIDTGKKE